MLILHGTPVVAFASSEQLAIGTASAARPPNIVYFVTDDQDQMLGGSFPPHGDATPMSSNNLHHVAVGELRLAIKPLLQPIAWRHLDGIGASTKSHTAPHALGYYG